MYLPSPATSRQQREKAVVRVGTGQDRTGQTIRLDRQKNDGMWGQACWQGRAGQTESDSI